MISLFESSPSIFEIVLLALFSCAFLVQLFYYLFYFTKMISYSKKVKKVLTSSLRFDILLMRSRKLRENDL